MILPFSISVTKAADILGPQPQPGEAAEGRGCKSSAGIPWLARRKRCAHQVRIRQATTKAPSS